MTERPSVGRAISWAFDTFKANPLPFLSLAAVVAVLQTGMNLGTQSMNVAVEACQEAATPGQINACQLALASGVTRGVFVFIAFVIFSFLAQIGVYRAALAVSLGVRPTFSMIWRTDRLGTYIATSLLMVLFTLLGLIACIIPGIVIAFLMQLAPYFVLDRGLKPMAAIKASMRIVRANIGPAILMVIFAWLVLALGGALWGLLTLVTLPFGTLFVVHMYRQFNGDTIA